MDFKDLRPGDRIRVERPYTEYPDPDEEPTTYRMWEGEVEWVNPRGEFMLKGVSYLFLEDGVMGDWYYTITKLND